MKRFYILFFPLFSIFFSPNAIAQQAKVDSLYKEYSKATVDTSKINLLASIFKAYNEYDIAKGVAFAREGLELSERIGYDKGICIANS